MPSLSSFCTVGFSGDQVALGMGGGGWGRLQGPRGQESSILRQYALPGSSQLAPGGPGFQGPHPARPLAHVFLQLIKAK